MSPFIAGRVRSHVTRLGCGCMHKYALRVMIITWHADSERSPAQRLQAHPCRTTAPDNPIPTTATRGGHPAMQVPAAYTQRSSGMNTVTHTHTLPAAAAAAAAAAVCDGACTGALAGRQSCAVQGRLRTGMPLTFTAACAPALQNFACNDPSAQA